MIAFITRDLECYISSIARQIYNNSGNRAQVFECSSARVFLTFDFFLLTFAFSLLSFAVHEQQLPFIQDPDMAGKAYQQQEPGPNF